MSYTRVDYEREMKQRFLASLTPEERLHGLPSDEVLSHYKPDEVLSHYNEEQIRAYLEQMQHSKN